MSTKNPKYWTCFKLENKDPKDLHCTHKFLGNLDNNSARIVEKMISAYFDIVPFKEFYCTFDEKKWFGENEDIHVLATRNKYEDFYLDLKEILDSFRKDDWNYTPHISCSESVKQLNTKIVGYCLYKDNTLIKEWN